jgi:hypothetical protein
MKKILTVIGILVAIPVAAFIIFCLYDAFVPKQCVVYLDNGLAQAVTVKIDGKETVPVKAHEFSQKVLSQGPHKLEAFNDKNELIDSAEFTYTQDNVGAHQKFIYNIKKASSYAEYTMEYGTAKVNEEDRVKPMEKQQFFKSPDQQMEFCDAFPKSVTMRKGGGGAYRVILAHYPPHKEYPCCNKFMESLKSK